MTAEAEFWMEQGYYDGDEIFSPDILEENHLREGHDLPPLEGYYLCQ